MHLNLEMPSEFIEAIREAVRSEVEIAVSNSSNKEEQLMTIANTAEFMQVSVSTVRQYINLGLPHFQEGQVIRFIKSDVIAWTRSIPIKGQTK